MQITTGLANLKQGTVAVTATLMMVLQGGQAIAGDPFRDTDPRPISDQTEDAFQAMFIEGDYSQTARLLEEIEGDADPLAYALKASIAYTEQDWQQLKESANDTIRYAEQLQEDDPLRGNLYLAIGHFFEGTYIYEKSGAFSVISKLQKVFNYLDAAEKHNPNDPELNLIKGYMDLLLAVNLPTFNTEDAITKFETHAAPSYLVDRGLAIAYRDLEEYDQALPYVENAIAATPDNPEIHYLKGQILYQLGQEKQDLELAKEAVNHFDRAIENADQLPESIRDPYDRERRLAQELVEEIETAQR